MMFNDVEKQSSGEEQPADVVAHPSRVELFGSQRIYLDRSEEKIGQEGDGPKRLLGWKTVSFIQTSDVVGIGILSMQRAFVQLGWVLALIILVLMAFLNVYIGVLLSRTVQVVPKAQSYKDLSSALVNRKFMLFIEAVFYVYLISTLGGILLALSHTLKEVFFHVELCDPVWTLISIAIVVIPIQMRSLSEIKVVYYVNVFCICLAVWLCIGFMIANMSSEHALLALEGLSSKTYLFPPEMTWITFFNGLSKMCFAYLGCYMYVQIMAEMKRPGDFPKAFIISGPYQAGMYALVGIVGFLYDGEYVKDQITESLNPKTQAPYVIVVAVALFFHLVVSLCIKTYVVGRSIHLALFPKTVNDPTKRGRFVWFGITVSLILLAFVVANVVPLFGKLTSILGGFAGPVLGYITPAIYYIKAKRWAQIGTFEKVILIVILLFSTILLLAGTTANVLSLIDALKVYEISIFGCNKISFFDSYFLHK